LLNVYTCLPVEMIKIPDVSEKLSAYSALIMNNHENLASYKTNEMLRTQF
jgi:hypothetical protein